MAVTSGLGSQQKRPASTIPGDHGDRPNSGILTRGDVPCRDMNGNFWTPWVPPSGAPAAPSCPRTEEDWRAAQPVGGTKVLPMIYDALAAGARVIGRHWPGPGMGQSAGAPQRRRASPKEPRFSGLCRALGMPPFRRWWSRVSVPEPLSQAGPAPLRGRGPVRPREGICPPPRPSLSPWAFSRWGDTARIRRRRPIGTRERPLCGGPPPPFPQGRGSLPAVQCALPHRL